MGRREQNERYEVEVGGTLREDGTLGPDQKPELPPGRVRVAAAVEVNCDRFLTNDTRLNRFPEIFIEFYPEPLTPNPAAA